MCSAGSRCKTKIDIFDLLERYRAAPEQVRARDARELLGDRQQAV